MADCSKAQQALQQSFIEKWLNTKSMRVFLNSKLQDLTVINCPSLIKSSLESALGCMILIDMQRNYVIFLKESFFFLFLEIYPVKYSGKIMLFIQCIHDRFPPPIVLNDSYQNDWSNSVCQGELCKVLQLPKYKGNLNFLKFVGEVRGWVFKNIIFILWNIKK